MKYKALVRGYVVDVLKIDFENEYIQWFDNQWSRTDPPQKSYDIESFGNIKLLRPTGFIDINGKEVYEGDCVRVEYGIGEVEYSEKQAMFIITWLDDPEANNEPLAYHPSQLKYGRIREDLEIINNIYESQS